MDDGASENTGRYNVRALERALRILDALSDGASWKLSELSELLELNSSTAYRLLATLVNYNYVERDEDSGGYRLGLACLELAHAYYNASDLRRHARPALEALRDQTRETVHLGILDRWDIVYLEKLDGLHAIGLMSSTVGGRSPSYCTGVGKMLLAHQEPAEVRRHFTEAGLHRFTRNTITDVDELLAHLQQVRERGYALDLSEHEPEVRCIAVPVRTLDGRVIAAISISGPASRIDPEGDDRGLIELAQQVARDVSLRLGYGARPSLAR
jgi:DNA-binding IclR family transcriptional regulator